MATVVEIANANLIEPHAAVIVKAAKDAGFEMTFNELGRLDIADAFALVDHESMGGRNIFGCDHGNKWTWEPPYCQVPVTAARVQALLRNIEAGGGQNGVGLTQLTTVSFVYEAERRGGAHLPQHQCSVGFEHLAELVAKLGYKYGVAAYNSGSGNPQLGVDNGYYDKIQAARKKWVRLLAGAAEEEAMVEYPTIWVVKDSAGWSRKETTGEFIRARNRPNAAFASDPGGWQYPESPGVRIPGPVAIPNSSDWMKRHPTRFDWRRDIADLVRSVEAQYVCYPCTYVDHPEGWGKKLGRNLDIVSVDFWGAAGRGQPISWAVGEAIVNRVLGDPNPPEVDWLIWYGRIWTPDAGWQPWQDDGTGLHKDHPHVTFK